MHATTDPFGVRLDRLSAAAIAINAPLGLTDMLDTITSHAREVVGAHHAVASTTIDGDPDFAQTDVRVSLGDRHAHLAPLARPECRSPLFALVCADNRTVRWDDDQLRSHADAPREPDPALPLRCWLAVPLVTRDGTNLGLLQLSDPLDEAFSDEDEAVAVQLAQLASVAVEKARLLEEAHRHLEHLRGLTQASLAINEPVTVGGVLDAVVRSATRLLEVDRARAWLGDDGATSHLVQAGPSGAEQVDGDLDGTWGGVLSAPLVDADGERVGALEIRRSEERPFADADEALLNQLAQVSSNAVVKARLTEQLAAQEAARFREELLSGISHDMQTPLATIVGLADLLVRDGGLDADEVEEIHHTISRQGRALRGLVQQFLDFSRLESARPLLVRPRPTDVVQAIDRTVALFEHHREIIVGAARGLPRIDVDPDRLDQILSNLISNAITYSDAAVRIVARHERGEVLIDVVDEGPGVHEDEQPRLFEKFHRGEASVGTSGTGLGLYITRALVETHGGRIAVHSNVGVGSRFTVSFPCADVHA